MSLKRLLTVLAFVPTLAVAQACPAPKFEKLAVPPASEEAVIVELADLVRVRVPAGVTRLYQTQGSLGVDYADGRRFLLQIERGETLRGIVKGKVGPLHTNAYTGATPEGCRVLGIWNLMERADYWLTSSVGPLTVYAYATGKSHHFDVIHSARPDVVVKGLMLNIDRSAFERLLASMQAM